MIGADDMTLLATADLALTTAALLSPPRARPSVPAAGDVAELARRLGRADLAPALEQALREAVEPTDEAEAEFRQLFDGATACPPNETAYVRRDKGALLADIAGFYAAFGFELDRGAGEKHDHVVAELQFAALVLVLAARAGAAGRGDARETSLDALRAFLEDHLLAWLESFATRLEQAAGPSHAALPAIVRAGGDALAVAVGLTTSAAAVPPRAEGGDPYECDGCPGGGG